MQQALENGGATPTHAGVDDHIHMMRWEVQGQVESDRSAKPEQKGPESEYGKQKRVCGAARVEGD